MVKTLRIFSISLVLACSTQDVFGFWFYGGDWDFRSFLESGRNSTLEDARIYENFELSGPLQVTVVLGNFALDGGLPTELYYEFRQNVAPGSGGDLLASGTVGAAAEMTGRSGFGFTEWSVSGNIPMLQLTPGQHWFTVTPVGNGAGHFYLTTTDGHNGVGSPLGDGNSYYDSDTLGADFDPTSDWLGKGLWDFSQGIDNIPEPATFLATLAGLGLLVFRKRRRA
ncbi:MAG: PEP-CTERM sorting domain-containing protein [Fimbriimonadales bacterium]